jgi:ubiquinone/menaquinone biosynthesis C-methylase UbiE
MKEEQLRQADLKTLAGSESEVWEGSSYYSDAEEWTWLFWAEDGAFMPMFRQLDLAHLLELACGHGRHSERILSRFEAQLESFTIMDILESNIQICRDRLASQPKLRTLVNDGVSFRPLDANSLTAIFCYDAMVHFDKEVVKSYLKECERVLLPGGKALLHHSNYSAQPDSHFGTNPHARAFMSAELFAEYTRAANLEVVEQKGVPWGGEAGLDCISLVLKATG